MNPTTNGSQVRTATELPLFIETATGNVLNNDIGKAV